MTFKKMFGITLMLCGLTIFLYPTISQRLINYQVSRYVDAYEEQHGLPQQMEQSENQEHTEGKEALYQQILSYNQEIFRNHQTNFRDAWNYEQLPLAFDGLEDDKLGYIQIPAMDLKLPLYIGASDEHLASGAAILGQTSIPIGGENTNSVIAGHRGWYNGSFFRDIEAISIGDHVFIRNPWEKLAYRVTAIDIIEPYETEKVMIQEGKDMVTLVTCHPYLSHGRYRYLVYCERDTDYQFSKKSEKKTKQHDKGQTPEVTPSNGQPFESSQDMIEKEQTIRMAGAAAIIIALLLTMMKSRRTGGG